MAAQRFGRATLALNAFVIGKTGLEYINGTWAGAQPANYPTLATLFTANVFSGGPAVPLLAPFMGCAYLAVSTINLAAALLFGAFESACVLGLSGVCFHIGMGVARLQMPAVLATHYLPGKQASLSYTQFAAGALCTVGCVSLLWAARVGKGVDKRA